MTKLSAPLTAEDMSNLPLAVLKQFEDGQSFEAELKKQDDEEFQTFLKDHDKLSVSEFAVRYYLETGKVLLDERLNEYKVLWAARNYGATVANKVLQKQSKTKSEDNFTPASPDVPTYPVTPERPIIKEDKGFKDTKDMFETTGVDKTPEITCCEPVELKPVDHIKGIDNKIADAEAIKNTLAYSFNLLNGVENVEQSSDKYPEIRESWTLNEYIDAYYKAIVVMGDAYFKLSDINLTLYGDVSKDELRYDYNFNFTQEVFAGLARLGVVKIKKINDNTEIYSAKAIDAKKGISMQDAVKISIMDIAMSSYEFSKDFPKEGTLEALREFGVTSATTFRKLFHYSSTCMRYQDFLNRE